MTIRVVDTSALRASTNDGFGTIMIRDIEPDYRTVA
jgi:hypothetical protein